MIILQILVFILVLMYLTFGGFTFYWALVGYPALKTEADKEGSTVVISFLAKFMYYHGVAFIIALVSFAVIFFAVGGAFAVISNVSG